MSQTGLEVTPRGAETPFLIFRLGASLFALPALAVREIHALPALSPLPETAPFIAGVLDLRGTIVPVMDLGARLGHNPTPWHLSDHLVVLHFDGESVAIIVTHVLAVERLISTQIEAAPAHGRERDLTAPFVAGVTHTADGIVTLLHLPHLLSWPTPSTNARPEIGRETAASRFASQAWTPSQQATLAERAARLRPAVGDDAESGKRAPVALVALGGEEMGIELSAVREFISVSTVAPVPCCPPHILGQINLRGDIVTLVDVRAALGTLQVAPPYFGAGSNRREAQNAVPVVVVHHHDAPVGIIIDQVRDVLYLSDDQRRVLDAKPGVGGPKSGPSGQYFSGGALHEGRLLPLLDVARLLSEAGLEVDESA